MRLVRVTLIFLTLLLAAPAVGGPWMREKGTGFSATSSSISYFLETANTTYLEFGLRDDLTIGADVGYFTDRSGTQSGHATAFLRRPLGRTDGSHKWAYELGLGARWVGPTVLPHLKTGLSWGRGIKLRQKDGWMNVDASVMWDLGVSRQQTKVDATLGLNFTKQFTGMVQLNLSYADNTATAKLSPSVIFQRKKGKIRFQIGAEADLTDVTRSTLKLGIWRAF